MRLPWPAPLDRIRWNAAFAYLDPVRGKATGRRMVYDVTKGNMRLLSTPAEGEASTPPTAPPAAPVQPPAGAPPPATPPPATPPPGIA